MSSKNVLIGVLAGIATGALLGVLLAPGKGSDTRKKVSKKGEDLAVGLEEKFNEFVDSVSEKVKMVKEEVTEFSENGKAKLEKLKKT
jgi:gas vesicle protein